MARPSRTPRPTRAPRAMHVFTPDGANRGGTCKGCGSGLDWWYHYQLCGKCLQGTPVAPYERPYR
jgi:hypothetical protein